MRDGRALRERAAARAALWVWALVAIGAALRFQGLTWDHGLMLHPDERNLVWAGLQLSREAPIPTFHAYNGLSVYPPRLIAELIWSEPGAPDLALIARIISATLSSLAILAAAGVARRMGGPIAAIAAAFFTALSPGLIQWAHFGTSESALALVPLVLWVLAADHATGRRGIWRTALLSGAVLGLALGLKTSALVFALIPLGALLIAQGIRTAAGVAAAGLAAVVGALALSGNAAAFGTPESPLAALAAAIAAALLMGKTARRWTCLAAAAAALGIAAALWVASTPQILTDWPAYRTSMITEGQIVAGTLDVFWTWQFTGARDGIFELRQLPALLDPVTVAIALAALGIILWRGIRAAFALPGRPADVAGRIAVPALVFLAGYALVVFGWHGKFLRYLAPVTGILTVLAGWQLARMLAGTSRAARAAATLSAAAALAVGLSFAAMYQAPDPRLAAWRHLAPRIEPGDTLLIEPHEVGPPFASPAAARFALRTVPLADPPGADKRARLAVTLATGTWLLISSRRNSGVLPRLRARFPDMCGYYRALERGELGWVEVARFRRRGPILGFWEPADFAEETFAVFDHPRPRLFRRIETLTPDEILARIDAASALCPPPKD